MSGALCDETFFKVTSAALDGNMLDRAATAVKGANEELAEKPHQVDFIELVHCDNTGNIDKFHLEEAANVAENIDDNNSPAQENFPAAEPIDKLFQGCSYCGQCKRGRIMSIICSHN